MIVSSIPLKIELNCEIFDSLPLEHRIRLIPLNCELYELNHDKTLRQWEDLRARSFTKMVSLLHKNVPYEMNQLRFGKEMIANDLEQVKQCFPERALRDALVLKERESVLAHINGCIVKIHSFLLSKHRFYAQLNLKDVEQIKKSCRAVHQFPSTPEWTAFSPRMRELLFQDYKNKLKQWEAEIDELDGARVENFTQLMEIFDGGARAHIVTLWDMWKKIRAEGDNFDANDWLATLAEKVDGPLLGQNPE